MYTEDLRAMYSADNVIQVMRYLFEEGKALASSVAELCNDYGLKFDVESLPDDVRFEDASGRYIVRVFRRDHGFDIAADRPAMWTPLICVNGRSDRFDENQLRELMSRVRYRVEVIDQLVQMLQELNELMRDWIEQARVHIERRAEQRLRSEEHKRFQDLLLASQLSG